MSKTSNSRKRLIFTALLFVLLFSCGGIKSEAKWIQNKNGTYSWQRKNGDIATSTWINNRKYVDENGIRVTGKYKIGKNYYYFKKSTGAVVKSKWIKNGSKWEYAQSNGVLLRAGKYKVGSSYYYFSKKGNRKTGFRTISGKTYYFKPKDSGKMAVREWVEVDGKYYRFNKNGVMRTSTWIGKRYVDKNGVSLTGLQTIGGKIYYFKESTRKKVTNTTKTVNGKTYEFDSNGVGTEVTVSSSSGKRNSTRSDLHSQYWSDPAVDDQTLLASIIYCEAGGESYTGQLAVGYVILNRVRSSSYPNTFAEVIYQNQQFEPARTGALTSCLKNGTATTSCKNAAKEVLSLYNSGAKPTLSGYGDFSGYYFFMTPASYYSIGLTSKPLQIGGHYFLKTWTR